jgi:hypothetical protein
MHMYVCVALSGPLTDWLAAGVRACVVVRSAWSPAGYDFFDVVQVQEMVRGMARLPDAEAMALSHSLEPR